MFYNIDYRLHQELERGFDPTPRMQDPETGRFGSSMSGADYGGPDLRQLRSVRDVRDHGGGVRQRDV